MRRQNTRSRVFGVSVAILFRIAGNSCTHCHAAPPTPRSTQIAAAFALRFTSRSDNKGETS